LISWAIPLFALQHSNGIKLRATYAAAGVGGDAIIFEQWNPPSLMIRAHCQFRQ
jgi:hypothetical protein